MMRDEGRKRGREERKGREEEQKRGKRKRERGKEGKRERGKEGKRERGKEGKRERGKEGKRREGGKEGKGDGNPHKRAKKLARQCRWLKKIGNFCALLPALERLSSWNFSKNLFFFHPQCNLLQPISLLFTVSVTRLS